MGRAHTSEKLGLGGLNFGYCSELTLLTSLGVSKQQVVVDEVRRLLGCEEEHSAITAARWSEFLRHMAVSMDMTLSDGETEVGQHMTIDAVMQQ